MKVETLKPQEFAGRYGNRSWLGDNTQAVIVGCEADLMGYLARAGFVAPYGIFPGSEKSQGELARDATRYGDMFLGALGGLTDDPLGVMPHVEKAAKDMDVVGKAGQYVPGFLKRLGATLPWKEREHARIHKLEDGTYAAEVHRDPGMGEYVGEGLWNGDFSSVLGGIWKAARYHYIDPKIAEYKGVLGQWATGLFSPQCTLKPAEVYA
jgi:hypothetical protein